jgi:hypothetical protein
MVGDIIADSRATSPGIRIMAIPVMGTEFVPPPGTAFDILLGRDILCRGVFSMSFDGHGVFSL